jgi:hypothetical protein
VKELWGGGDEAGGEGRNKEEVRALEAAGGEKKRARWKR